MEFENFVDLESVVEHLNNNYGEDLFEEIDSYDLAQSSVYVHEGEDTIIVGYLESDPEFTNDYFGDYESIGEFIVFSSPDERDKKVTALSKTKKLFFLVDRYQHGNVHYSVSESSGYPDRQWDVTSGCAMYIPESYSQSNFRKNIKKEGYEEAYKKEIASVNSILNEYSEWVNGESYRVCIKTFDKQGNLLEDDNSGGYIGYSHSEKELTDAMNNTIREEVVKKLATNIIIESDVNPKELPFKIDSNNLTNIKVAYVYDHTLVTAQYLDGKAIFYDKKADSKKAFINEFGETQQKYNISIESFLENNMKSGIKSVIREQLLNEEKNTIKTTIKP